MGCAFSCFRVVDDDDDDDDDERQNPEPPAFRYCLCLRCFTLTQEFYTVLFQRGVHVTSSSVQGAASQSGSVAEGSSIPESYRAPPRPLPYDDPRCSRLPHQREGLVSRGDKASSHFHEESEPLRRTIDAEDAGRTHKFHGYDCEGRSKSSLSQSSLKFPSKETASGVTYIFSSSEDECPTCLEEYTSENPRITMQCSHHYHLSCIYEWMERSEACPVCGKVMVFNETN